MYLHIIKIKINIYIFYTRDGTAMNISRSLLHIEQELKSECARRCHLDWNYGLCGHGKQNPWEAIRHFFFFFLSFSSSSSLLGGSQFLRFRLWNVCSNVRSHLPPAPSNPPPRVLCKHLVHGLTLGPKGAWEHGGFTRGKRRPSQCPCSVDSMEIPQPRMSLVSVLFTNVLPRWDEKTKSHWRTAVSIMRKERDGIKESAQMSMSTSIILYDQAKQGVHLAVRLGDAMHRSDINGDQHSWLWLLTWPDELYRWTSFVMSKHRL